MSKRPFMLGLSSVDDRAHCGALGRPGVHYILMLANII
jgi:hypothetical protein